MPETKDKRVGGNCVHFPGNIQAVSCKHRVPQKYMGSTTVPVLCWFHDEACQAWEARPKPSKPTLADCLSRKCPCLEAAGECDCCDHPGVEGCTLESGFRPECVVEIEPGIEAHGEMCWQRHVEYYQAMKETLEYLASLGCPMKDYHDGLSTECNTMVCIAKRAVERGVAPKRKGGADDAPDRPAD